MCTYYSYKCRAQIRWEKDKQMSLKGKHNHDIIPVALLSNEDLNGECSEQMKNPNCYKIGKKLMVNSYGFYKKSITNGVEKWYCVNYLKDPR